MFKPIPVATLSAWRALYTQNTDLPTVSESAGISLELLKNFIAAAEKDCPGVTGLRVYFVRYPLENDLSYLQKVGNKPVSQLSLAFVPVKDNNPGSFGGVDFPMPDDPSQILTLAVCAPEGPQWDESTGLCPPKCVW